MSEAERRSGRFDHLPSRNEPDGEDERFRALRYVVDADAVAAAIVERMLAGRLPDVWRST